MMKVLTKMKMKNLQNQRKLKNLHQKDHQRDITKVTNHKDLTMKYQQRRTMKIDDQEEDQIDNQDEILQKKMFHLNLHVEVQRNLLLNLHLNDEHQEDHLNHSIQLI
jgi:hypothetical protein